MPGLRVGALVSTSLGGAIVAGRPVGPTGPIWNDRVVHARKTGSQVGAPTPKLSFPWC